MLGAMQPHKWELKQLVRDVIAYHETHGRDHLPWRKTRDPYRILVSEVMLQQTQVDRVIPKYEAFTAAFPDAATLAHASFPQVLALWSGLGYNRRAKYLHEAAKMIRSAKTLRGGEINTTPTPPRSVFSPLLNLEFLESLPGVGTYTARAVMTFAYDSDEVFIETNIRTIFTHYLFCGGLSSADSAAQRVGDAELLPLVADALALAKQAGLSPREWYGALMDFGSHLKRQGLRINNRSAHYAKQSTFKGSARQLRGMILRELLKSAATPNALEKATARPITEVEHELAKLVKENVLTKIGKKYSIANA